MVFIMQALLEFYYFSSHLCYFKYASKGLGLHTLSQLLSYFLLSSSRNGIELLGQSPSFVCCLLSFLQLLLFSDMHWVSWPYQQQTVFPRLGILLILHLGLLSSPFPPNSDMPQKVGSVTYQQSVATLFPPQVYILALILILGIMGRIAVCRRSRDLPTQLLPFNGFAMENLP